MYTFFIPAIKSFTKHSQAEATHFSTTTPRICVICSSLDIFLLSHLAEAMFKFVASDGGGFGQKRHQAPRACEACRRRKKRCDHFPAASRIPPTPTHTHVNNNGSASQRLPLSTPTTEAPSGFNPDRHGTPESLGLQRDRSSSHQPAVLEYTSPLTTHDAQRRDAVTAVGAENSTSVSRNDQNPKSLDSRFIGDLSPESIFLAATSPDATRGISMNDSVGVWLTSALSRRASASASSPPVQSPSNLFYGSTSLVQKVLVPLLEQECLSTIPPASQTEALSKIYFEKMHPIFPVIDENQYRELHESDPGRILIQQSICLAASKNFTARQLLIMKDSDQLLSCREFGDRMSGAMRLSIEMGLVKNKIVLIQVLALMSQFIDDPDDGDMSSQLCAKAVHHVQSIGLHVKGHQQEPTDEYGATLLCCIWAIDRMNAAFNGRPVLMHDRDIRKDFELCVEQQESCFRLFLQVVVLLDKVIDLYRPSNNPDSDALDEAYPSFEDLVVRFDGSQIGTTSLSKWRSDPLI
jgi:hypothetical protein